MNTNNKRSFLNKLFFKLNQLIATFIVIGVVLSCPSGVDPDPDPPIIEGSGIKEISATSISTNEVTLFWGGDHDYSHFVLLQEGTEIADNIAGTNAAGEALTDFSYTVDDLNPNTQYGFSLKACKGEACSEETLDAVVWTMPNPPEDFNFVRDESTSTSTLTSLLFTWKAPILGGADHYILYQDNIAISGEIRDLKESVDGLDSGNSYTFGLVACNEKNLCSTTNEKTVRTSPDVVTDLVIKGDPESTMVTISWTEPSETTSYVVSKQEGGGAIEEIAGPPSAGDSEFTIDGLTPNTDYTFYLKACGGLGCSDNSSVKATTRPDSPKNLNFVRDENTPTSLSFAWDAPTGGAAYYVLSRDGVVVAGKITGTKQDASGLEPGTKYIFDLVACNKNDLCSTASTDEFTTPPSKVTGLVVKGDPGSTTVTISWMEPPTTTSYVVSKQKAGETTFVKVDNSPSAGDSEFTIGDLTSETEYTFSLQACNAAGCSESVTVNGKTVEIVNPPANAPGNLRHTRVASTAVELEWDAVEGATYYPVLYTTGGGSEVSNFVANASKFATTVALTANTEYTFSVKACNKIDCFDQASSTNITTAPEAPQVFSKEAVTSTTVDLRWDTVTGANSYIVSRNGDVIATNTGTTYTATRLDASTGYKFSMKACNDFGCSLEATVDATTTPEAPGGLTHETVTSTTVGLKWDTVTGANSYIVSRNGGAIATNTGNPAATTYSVAELTANTPYTFSVKACNDSGCSENTDLALTTAPDTPQGFSSEAVTSKTVGLKWDTVTGASKYIVYRDGNAIITNTGNPPATMYTATGLTASTGYKFSVKACNDFGCSLEATVDVTTAPNTSGSLTYETVTSTTVGLKWDAVTGANSYIVSRDGIAIITNTGNPAATTYIAGGLNAGTEYTFSVRACNNSGCSDNTDLTLTTAPDTPQGFSSEAVNSSTTVDLKWNTVTGANSYVVYRDGNEIATSAGTTYRVTGLNAGTEYSFSVKACNDFGCSENSSDLTLTTLVEAPQNLAIGTIRTNSIELIWNTVTGSEYYIVYTNSSDSSVPVATNGGENPATTYVVGDLIQEVEYTFTVRACNSQGCSDFSDPVQTTITPNLFDFFKISYPNMASEASATSMPVIVSGANCDLETLTVEGKATYSINFNDVGIQSRNTLAIDSTTGVVNNRDRSSTAGVYKVKVTVNEDSRCNTNVLVYNTYTPTSKVALQYHIFPGSFALHGDTGNYNYIDTSKLTDFYQLFYNRNLFNGDISEWDTSQAKNMSRMFELASQFNSDIGGWDTSQVENMSGMFLNASAFNQPIGEWKIHNVTRMDEMFRSASAFNQPLNGWSVSNVQYMNRMFNNAIQFDRPLNNWKTVKVQDMGYMFLGAAKFDQDLSMWDISQLSAQFPNVHTDVFKGSAMEGDTTKYPDSTWTP